MLNQKELTIIKLLFDHRHTYITSREIAKYLAVSDRTARKYSHLVADILIKNGANLEAKQGRGYKLFIRNESKFQEFYQQNVYKVASSIDMMTIQESESRQYFILHQLFFIQKMIKVDDLASELYVSRSTISNDLVEIKKMLKPERLELKSKTGKGIYICGEEQNKRHFIMNYFFMNHLEANLYTFSMYVDLLQGVNIEEIVFIVLDECQRSALKLSDVIIYNLVLHIGLVIKRLKTGFQIENSEIELSRESKEYQTALQIVYRLQAKMNIDFPEEEALYIAVHLKNRAYTEKIMKKATYNEVEIKAQLLDVLANLDQDTDFEFQEDINLVNGLMMHFTPLLSRLQNDMEIRNPLLEEVKEKYAQLFSITVDYFSVMPVFEKYQVSEGEWAYLTIHLIAAVERFYSQQKVRVLVICATGLGSSQMLKIRLEHEFGSKLSIDSILGYYELTKLNLDNIDLIISSISLPEENFKVPIIYVSVFLGEEDIHKLNQSLSQFKGAHQTKAKPFFLEQPLIKEETLLIQKNLQKELFVYFPNKVTKKQVLDELISRVEKLEKKEIAAQLLQQLALRESFGSVAFSPQLAVPHPIDAVTDKSHVAVAVVPRGVVWSEDHPAIHLVIMTLPGKSGTGQIEKLNQLFVPIIEDDTFSQALIKCQTYEEFLRVFEEMVINQKGRSPWIKRNYKK